MQPTNIKFSNSYGQPEGCQQGDCDFYVEWRTIGNFIDFRMEGNGNGWIVLGITAQNLPLNTVRQLVVHTYYLLSILGLSDYRDSIHYRDSLRLFMNKIVDCLTIQIVISYKIS